MREGFDNLQFTSQKRKPLLGRPPLEPNNAPKVGCDKGYKQKLILESWKGRISFLVKHPERAQALGCTLGNPQGLTSDGWHREYVAKGTVVRVATPAPSSLYVLTACRRKKLFNMKAKCSAGSVHKHLILNCFLSSIHSLASLSTFQAMG